MDAQVEFVIDQLADLGVVTTRKMFGGYGFYCEGLFFALMANGVFHLKVDDSNRADFESRGCEAFQPFEDRPSKMSYYEIPSEVLERPKTAVSWARRSVEIARKQPSKKKKSKKAKSSKRASGKSPSLASLRNIGPKSAAWLAEVGINTRADLERLGSIGAFRAVREQGLSSSLNLLYALEGALLDVRWDELPAPLKESLRKAAR